MKNEQAKIEVFKLGGAFFEADIIVNFFKKLNNNQKRLYVVSAIKGITRLLEIIYFIQIQKNVNKEYKKSVIKISLSEFKKIHLDLIKKLLKNDQQRKISEKAFSILFKELKDTVWGEIETLNIYQARILKFGELASSKILSDYLEFIGHYNKWLDSRDYLKTSESYIEAEVLQIDPAFKIIFNKFPSLILQGFIGKTPNGKDSLLGYDGSDYSATKFANSLLNSEKEIILTFWKDVNGVYTENPTKNLDAKLIKKLSRQDYIKNVKKNNSFVVRPDSISSLNKNIKVKICSYINLDSIGTEII